MAEYITIAEFARLANVTTQAVYQRTSKDLASYCKVIGKRKMIDKSALSVYGDAQNNENLTNDCKEKIKDESEMYKEITNDKSSNYQPIAQDCKKEANEPNELAKYLKAENERLVNEIGKLQSIIEKKDCQIADFADKFASLASREQEISARALQSGQALLHNQKINKVNEDLDNNLTEDEMIKATENPQKKKGFFAKLFG